MRKQPGLKAWNDTRELVDRSLSKLTAKVVELIDGGDFDGLDVVFAGEHEGDIAEVLNFVDEEFKAKVFRHVPSDIAPDVLAGVRDSTLTTLLATLSDVEISEAVNELPTDEAVDIIGELPDEDASRVLDMLGEEDKENLQELLKFPEESAGGIMESEFVAVPEGVTVGQAVQELREVAEDVEQVHNVYAVDGEGRLLGILELWRLAISYEQEMVAPLIERDHHSVPVDMDQEEVASFARRYDLVEIPVVDADNKLVGRITIDDVLDVIEEEATEDISRMAGTGEDDFHEESVLRITWLRFPWLLIGLAGGIGSALLMSRFAMQLEKVIALAFFVPVIMAMGGSVGIQCSAVVVRSLALGELEAYRMGKRLAREIMVATLNGLLIAAILTVVALLWRGDPMLGLVIGLAMFLSILLAATTGTVVPMILKRYGFDPALATGPFITTTNDVLNLLIYFTVASLLLTGA